VVRPLSGGEDMAGSSGVSADGAPGRATPGVGESPATPVRRIPATDRIPKVVTRDGEPSTSPKELNELSVEHSERRERCSECH
jgi:hypothetical protein